MFLIYAKRQTRQSQVQAGCQAPVALYFSHVARSFHFPRNMERAPSDVTRPRPHQVGWPLSQWQDAPSEAAKWPFSLACWGWFPLLVHTVILLQLHTQA